MQEVLQITREPLAEGWVETWLLNAPAQRNALSEAVVDALHAACVRALGDAELRGVVLRGAGGHFCAGGSLGNFAQAIGTPLPAGERDPLVAANRHYGALLQVLSALPQWLMVVVEGAAMGGGVGLVCCADHVLAHADARLGMPEVTLGLVPAQISPFVVRRLGMAQARRWLLSGETLSASAAERVGLVNEVVQDGLDAAVHAAVLRYSAAAPQAVAATKRLLSEVHEQPLPRLLDHAAADFACALRGSEAAQGLAAFAACQPPPWRAAAAVRAASVATADGQAPDPASAPRA